MASGALQKPHAVSRWRSIGAPQLEQRTIFSSARTRPSSAGVSERTNCFSRKNWKNGVRRPCSSGQRQYEKRPAFVRS